jgi:PTH1 family peptidyl-tRNA hydrolase
VAGSSWVLVGLGNPGSRYAPTRHNAGFRLLDRIARDLRAEPDGGGERVRVCRTEWAGSAVALVWPLTYMNRSGEILVELSESAEAGPGRHLVLLDDVALPFGTLRFRTGGSAGGHNGLQSVLDRLGTDQVPRLRLGVGPGDPERDLAEFVLEPFSDEEEQAMDAWLERASEGVRVFIAEGPDEAMTRFNRAWT